LRVGVHLGQPERTTHAAAVQAIAIAAEQVGYDSVWAGRSDPAGLSSLDVAGLAAAATLTVGVGVVIEPGTEPAAPVLRLARECDGRLSVAVERAAEPGGHRLLDELTGPQGGRPVRVLVAGSQPPELDLAAGRADGWLASAIAVDEVETLWAEVRRRAGGRERPAHRRVLVAQICVDLRRPVERVADDVEVLRRIGAAEVVVGVVGDPSLDDLLAAYAAVAEVIESRSNSSGLAPRTHRRPAR
jgi:alkanesulfonate monooxygenase SsuD/methylene tetrahydromethanopterin reductase-like flavin-dependent oxidoreductase (luciferase family)